MATLPHLACNAYAISCSLTRDHHNPQKKNMGCIKIHGNLNLSKTKVDAVSHNTVAATSTVAESVGILGKEIRQNIPTKKQFIDPYRQGLIINDGGVGYRQTVVIRSYEVGIDKTATIESILNLLQETALNHVWMSGLLGDGFGATHGMTKNHLIWVVSRMQLEVDHYPIWGEVMEIDTWIGASGKIGMRRDWLLRSHASGLVYARATSTWVMINHQTRRLSKMPDEVKAEISPWFIEKKAIKEGMNEKIEKLDDKAKFVLPDLKPHRSDLDMNQHVNNVKYAKWMLETIPEEFLEGKQLSRMVLEYRRECGCSDIIQSLCEPDEADILQHENVSDINGFSDASGFLRGCFDEEQFKYTHLLQSKGEHKNEEIIRGRTSWKKNNSATPFSA